ncbi:hypothetical protein Dimus_018856 [Dionaea muscipula]
MESSITSTLEKLKPPKLYIEFRGGRGRLPTRRDDFADECQPRRWIASLGDRGRWIEEKEEDYRRGFDDFAEEDYRRRRDDFADQGEAASSGEMDRPRVGHLKLLGSYIHGPFDVREKDKSPRVMIRHMSYVISMKDHELPYGDWLTMVFEAFGVPLVDKKGEEPKRYDFFEETFLTMCKSTRENGIWWIGSGENRRRDDDEAAPEEEAEGEDEGNQVDFDWEAVIDEATVEGESGSGEKFYDAKEDAQGSPELPNEIPAEATTSSAQQKDKEPSGVDPSGPTGRDAEFPSSSAI